MHNIVFFDSSCGVCCSFIQWIIKNDKNFQFKFSSLYGNYASYTLPNFYQDYLSLNSVILIKNQQCFIKFEAIIEILVGLYPTLNQLKKVLTFKFIILVGNFFYDLFARSRLRKFLMKKQCMIMKDLKYEERFIA